MQQLQPTLHTSAFHTIADIWPSPLAPLRMFSYLLHIRYDLTPLPRSRQKF